VQAIGITGVPGPLSIPATITTLAPPGPPTLVVAADFDRISGIFPSPPSLSIVKQFVQFPPIINKNNFQILVLMT
jgi:hypothetical protein